MPDPRTKQVLLSVALVAVLAAGGWAGVRYWRYAQIHVHTDDAYVAASVIEVSSRVAGHVVEVAADENWQVAAGRLLVRLDPADVEVEVAEKEAALRQARERIDQQYAGVESARAEVLLAQADRAQRRRDLERARGLFERQALPEEGREQAETALRMAAARLHAARKRLEQAEASLGGRLDGPRYQRSGVERAESALAAARLRLEYTRITAPASGFVSQKRVEVGQWVQPGQRLMTLVPLHRVWIEANFKETQLTHVRIGQPARIVADLYPDDPYRGRVESLSSGTGAAFSLLPPENATGNWVKIVQRVPVKIALDAPPPPDRPLRIGLSAEVVIDTTDRGGPALLPLRAGPSPGERARTSRDGRPVTQAE